MSKNEQQRLKTYKWLQAVEAGWEGDSKCANCFFLVKMQDSIPRVTLQARKMHLWGSGVTHCHAGMSKNEQK